MKNATLWLGLVWVVVLVGAAPGGRDKKVDAKATPLGDLFPGLKFRSIGPAFSSGRISDFAVNPRRPCEYFVAVASGHIWKTVNGGTTWTPVFDNYGAYAIGCLAMDPSNPNLVWAGTGENNHQRALGYGDGVYRTEDGGKSWVNMGLKNSRQIGRILVDPRDGRVVWVAAEGSAWGPGGDRGLFKTTDGGKTWTCVLAVSADTGINDAVMDPRNPDLVYASSEQRRRHAFTKIGGGPETAIYRTGDGGATWQKLESGLPKEHMGGIGLAVSPANPDVVYAIIEAANGAGGFFRSTDRGASWAKMSGHTAQGQYYNEIFCDPRDVDKIYSVETISQVSEDGGRTWRPLGNHKRHVDDHALWIDPTDTRHLLVGGDGGVYETFDGGEHFRFKENLPVTQFYRVAVDDSRPFYYVYGGTQDNNSMGGPSRNARAGGVTGDEWFVTNGGDGFWSQIDPTNPDIVYAESQYGGMVRYDRRSGEAIDIRPQPRQGEATFKWNWDTPLLLSPHSPTRLYCAANKVFRSDDRGDSWTVISGDLSTGTDRNSWPVMGKHWSVDAVAKDVSTSLWGTVVSLAESPLREGLLFAGTDDGLVQVTEDGGSSWRRAGLFPGVPAHTWVSDLLPSAFDENVVYATFNNHLRDDFRPYVLRSEDKGRSWEACAAGLPANGPAWTIAQDSVNPGLLFLGTDLGFFVSVDGAGSWHAFRSGLPTVAVRDIALQKRENDLVLATFGRGFYVLDDYTPLRLWKPELERQAGHLFPVRPAWMYIERSERYGQGSAGYAAPNPPFGAVFSWWLRDEPKTRKQRRQDREKELFARGAPLPQPDREELRRESLEVPPYLLFTIRDEEGQVVRQLTQKPARGVNRCAWNLRLAAVRPMRLEKDRFDPLVEVDDGMLAMPGTYTVSMALCTDGEVTPLAGPVAFQAEVLANATLPAADRRELFDFQKRLAALARSLAGAEKYAAELGARLAHVRQALLLAPADTTEPNRRAVALATELDAIDFALHGTPARASREEVPPEPMALMERLNTAVYTQWRSTSAVTRTQLEDYRILREEFPPVLERIRKAAASLAGLEEFLEKAGGPWTPGRLPSGT